MLNITNLNKDPYEKVVQDCIAYLKDKYNIQENDMFYLYNTESEEFIVNYNAAILQISKPYSKYDPDKDEFTYPNIENKEIRNPIICSIYNNDIFVLNQNITNYEINRLLNANLRFILNNFVIPVKL